ncbi:glycosyltransferase family 4 protein [Leptospira limi]|uniref:Glycosyltransferase family 4 protein n=1 Tax=Leptospira limi TaxID=2950023 RepID=A0ABT3LYZ5_9LEPT|nr:glycosyltransferase family 4 protein [Leptospira limi]MCW7462944.1 glycosyltransferase family 4 protein [Leptospira limi]
MNILIIVDDYLPSSIKVTAKMMHELALELKQLGNEVLVITPDSYRRAEKSLDKIEIFEGISVLRFPSGRLKNVSKIIRLFNEFLLPFRAWMYGKYKFKDFKMDLIIYYSPSIFWGWLVYKLKKLTKTKSYLILRDFFPQWAIDNGIISKKSLITKLLLLVENWNYRQADTIGLMSQKNLEWFCRYHNYDGNAKLEVLFNWVTDKSFSFQVGVDKSNYRKQLNLDEKVVFFYGGNIGHAQDMSQVLRLAKSLENYASAHIVLVGAGDEVNIVREFIRESNISNLTLLDPVTQEEYAKMLSEFDVGLFFLNYNHSTHNFPGKILSYLVQGLPILGSVNPGNDLKDIIEEANAGYVVISGDDVGLYECAKKLLEKELRSSISVNAKKLQKSKFDLSVAAKQIIKEVI